MGKLAVLFIIIVSAYVIATHSKTFHGYCEPIVNEDVCVDKGYFENLTTPKSFQVIAHMSFNSDLGINLFYSYLKKNLVATISNEGEIMFSINCFKIPYDIRYQKNLNYRLKVKSCNNFEAEFKEGKDVNHELFNYTEKSLIMTTIYKVDKYFTIWGCNANLEHITDRAAWILMDNDGQIEYDAKKLKSYLDDLLVKMKSILTKNGLSRLNSSLFTIFNITNDYYSCYDQLEQKAVYNYIKIDLQPILNFKRSLKAPVEEEDSTKLKITVALLMITGHIVFMFGFFWFGYQIVIRCFKE